MATAPKPDDRYRTRSRCPHCNDWVVEGSAHDCPYIGGSTDSFENPRRGG